jgi:hypothetical protein
MKTLKSLLMLAMLGGLLTVTGCIKPPKVPTCVEIKPNATAWVIPLDGNSQSGQAQFNSVAFLEAKKVATKRIWIDKVEQPIGRFSWEIQWIDAVRVIAVDRSLVTREWTADAETGTAQADQSIHVNTKDNIGLKIGINITVSIDESDASTYLYYHGERPLADVTDQNLRGFVLTTLSGEVASMNLVDFQENQAVIYKKLSDVVTAECKSKGITVQSIGNAKGWQFIDPKIQESINKSYIAQQDNKTAEMEQNATKTRNATAVLVNANENSIKVATAQAQADAAIKLASAKEAASFQNELQINLLLAQAKMAMATKWNGSMPASILPSTSPLLLNLGDGK